jgi:catalase
MKILGLTAALLAALAVSPARAQDASTPEQIVNVMNKLWGSHPGFRANHAKGLVVTGSFTPTAEAAKLSKAEIFSGKAVKLTVRFSDSTGLPTIPDGAPNANPHGMSLMFNLADGGEVDVVTNSLKFFPVATGEDFRDLLTALSQSPPGSKKPTKAEQFFAAHPSAPAAFGSVGTPASFAQETYNGVDAFIFVNAAGKRQAFRFRIDPVAGTKHIAPAEAATQPPDFLVGELPGRLAHGPVSFHLMAQLAGKGDSTRDPSKPWPATRKLVNMGTITITAVVKDSDAAQKKLVFLPTNLQDGIEPSDDPLIDTRAQAYAISFSRRTQ